MPYGDNSTTTLFGTPINFGVVDPFSQDDPWAQNDSSNNGVPIHNVQLYDQYGNPKEIIHSDHPVPEGRFTTKPPAAPSSGPGDGVWPGVIPNNGGPGIIGSYDPTAPFVGPVAPAAGAVNPNPTPGHGTILPPTGITIGGVNTGTIGGGGSGLFGTNLDIGFGGLTVGNILGAGVGLAGLGGGSSGPSVTLGPPTTQQPETPLPPDTPEQPETPLPPDTPQGGTQGASQTTTINPGPIGLLSIDGLGGSGSTNVKVPQVQNDTGVTVIPPIIPAGGGNSQQPSVTLGPTMPILGGTTPAGTGQPAGDVPATTINPGILLGGLGGGAATTTTNPTVTQPTTTTNPTTVPTTTNILDRDYLREGTTTNAGNAAVNPGTFGNYSTFSGQYGAQDQANFMALLQRLGVSNEQLTQFANAQTTGGNTALRTGNVNDAAALGGTALNTLKALNPNQYSSLDAANAAATTGAAAGPSSFQTSLGTTFGAGPQFSNVTSNSDPLLGFASNQAMGAGYGPLGTDLQNMARQQLALGGGLSDEQKRNATQAAREGWAARGLINSNGAVGAEVLNRDAYSQALLNQRQGFAQNVNQLGQSQQGLNNNFLLGTLGAGATANSQSLGAQQANQAAGLQAQGQNQALGLNLANLDNNRLQQNFSNLFSNAQLQSAGAFNPFTNSAITANTANQGMNSTLFNQGSGFSSGALGNQNVQNLVNPYNPYAQDVFGSNYNAANARSIAAGNNAAAAAGAQDQASGQIANSFLNLLGAYFGRGASGTTGS